MPLSPQQRAEFVDAYTRTLISAWSSEDFARRLETDLPGALQETGLQIPEGAVVELVRTVPDGRHEGNLDVQIELWERGLENGRFELHVPETPQVDMAELSEGDLEGVAAGAVSINCCCCPCCSCT
jgi:hypothetical protein